MLTAARIHITEVPMKKAFVHTRAARAVAENLVMTVDIDGHLGVGESVPRDYVTGETVESAFNAIAQLGRGTLSEVASATTLESALLKLEQIDLPTRLMQEKILGLAAGCAVELALLDALGKKFSVALSRMAKIIARDRDILQEGYQPAPLTRTLGYDSKIEKQPASDLRRFQCVKLKVGRDDGEDIERIAEARRIFGEDIFLSIDVNMGWSLERAESMARKLKPYRVSWYEQPFPIENLSDCSRFRQVTGEKILLDESLCSMKQAVAAVEAGACDMFNLRLSKCGGFISTLRLAEFARQNRLPYILGGHPGQNAILTAADRAFVSSVKDVVSCEALFTTANLTDLFSTERVDDHGFDWQTTLRNPGLGIAADSLAIQKYTTRFHDLS